MTSNDVYLWYSAASVSRNLVEVHDCHGADMGTG